MFKRGLDSRDRSRVILRLLGNLATSEFKLSLHESAEARFKAILQVPSPNSSLFHLYSPLFNLGPFFKKKKIAL